MPLQPIFSNELAKIQVNAADSYLELRWLKHPESSDFRSVITRAFKYAHQHQLTKWLCNMQQADFLEIADQHWLVQEIFSAFNPQLKHEFAYIIRPMVLEVLTANHIHVLVELDEQLKEKITVAIFNDMAPAQQWLFTATN